MDWLNVKEIKERSKTIQGALEVSIEHHEQILNATKEELLDGFFDGEVEIGVNSCGLCMHFRHAEFRCEKCPLSEWAGLGTGDCCCKAWVNLCGAVGALKATHFDKHFEMVKDAEKILITRLQVILNEVRSEQLRKDKKCIA